MPDKVETKFFDKDWAEVSASDAWYAVRLTFDTDGTVVKSERFVSDKGRAGPATSTKQRSDDALAALATLPDRFVWIPDFVSLSGSTLYARDREPHDIDVIVRAQETDNRFALTLPLDAGFAIKLERALKYALGEDKPVQYSASPYGPNWGTVSAYDLCLVRKPQLQYVQQNEPEFAKLLYKGGTEADSGSAASPEGGQAPRFAPTVGTEVKAETLSASALKRKLRGASADIRAQALATFKENTVISGRMVLSLKPLRPAPQGERQTVDQFYKYIEEHLEFPLWVSCKADGATEYCHGTVDSKITIFSDDGEDNTEHLPHIVDALKRIFKGKSFVCGAEFTKWVDGNHYPREAAIGDVKKSADEDLVANIFRLVYYDGEDLHGRPFSETWAIAQKLPVDTKSDSALYPRKNGQINLIPHYKAENMSDLKRLVEKLAYRPGAEGVVVKRADGDFPLDGEPGTPATEVKFHKSTSAKLRIVSRKETHTAGVYVYHIAIEGLEIGDTFGSKLDLPDEAVVEVESEQTNIERDEAGKIVKVSFWAPEIIGKTDGKPESLDTIIARAREHGVLREKVRKAGGEIEYLPNDSGKPSTANKGDATKQRDDNAADYPDEDKKLRYVVQLHGRGRAVHGDLRVEYKRGDDHYLKGWTIMLQQPDAIKEPILTVADMKQAMADPDAWKLDLKTGIIKPREIRGGVVRRGDLRAVPKASEIPSDWLTVQGITDKPDPGEPIPAGSTVNFPGVFVIVAKGTVEWGAQKPWAQEFWLDGDWKGRWLFRLVERKGEKWYMPENEAEYEAMKAADVLPPGVEEQGARTGAYWLLVEPTDATPYVLSKDAVDKSWLPPRGTSALPARICKSIPDALRYWEQDEKQALESRRTLVEDYEELGGPKMAKKAAGKFVLARRTWKGQQVIRMGPSTVVHDLYLDTGEPGHWTLAGDPTRKDSVAAQPASGSKVVVMGAKYSPDQARDNQGRWSGGGGGGKNSVENENIDASIYPLAASGGLPMARGADWYSLNNERDYLRDRAIRTRRGIDDLIDPVALDELDRIASDDQFVLAAPQTAYWGLSPDAIADDGTVSALGTRSLALTPERAAHYGDVYRVNLPIGTRVVTTQVMDEPEVMMLPGSRFLDVGDHKLTVLADGTDYVRDLSRFRQEIENLRMKETQAAQKYSPDQIARKSGLSAPAKDVFSLSTGNTVDVQPGSALNPTKNTPCAFEVLDKGAVQVLTDDAAVKKYDFDGKVLKGGWLFVPEDEADLHGFWLASKSGGPKVKD